MDVVKWLLALIGHIGLCCVAFNRIHASSFPRGSRKGTEKLIVGLAVFPPIFFVWEMFRKASIRMDDFQSPVPLIWYYLQFCMLFGGFLICRWAFRKLTVKSPPGITCRGRQCFDIKTECRKSLLAGTKARICGMVPGNQILHLSVDRWDIEIPNLPTALNGLKIAHLSDTHFTGLILPEYFHSIVDKTNEFNPDLIFMTGDVIDESICMDWIDSIFSSLRSRHGRFYVLGNHDHMVRNEREIRNRMAKAGMVSAGDGRWHDLQINGATVRVAGNEQPWFMDSEFLPSESGPAALKLLLSHSPDQVVWANVRGFDLMFAGHTHGGQVRLPFFGPIIAPSRYGTKYASGTFRVGKTLMHVSRGLSGDEPIRLDCLPELGLFTLQSESA